MSVVAVVGASGFVGSTLVERLWTDGQYEVRPLIHSTGSAGRLARHDRPLTSVDITVKASVRQALAGSTHVVNCSRGSIEVMDLGLKNLLEVSLEQRVERFVHLSSSAVYGPTFQQRAVISEEAPVRVTKRTYGWKKMRQDRRILEAVRRGLPCVTLCPPNIAGPHSGYLLEVIGALRSGRFVFVDEGRMPCDLVDVENLAQAITLALACESADGHRIFVTNGELTTWRDLVEELAPLAEVSEKLRSLTIEEAVSLHRSQSPRLPSVVGALKHVVSSDVRSILSRDSLFAGFERGARSIALRLPERGQAWLRGSDPDTRLGRDSGKRFADVYPRLVTQQLRNVHYGIDKARRVLAYEPAVSFPRSAEAFRRWYAVHTGFGGSEWPLLRSLHNS